MFTKLIEQPETDAMSVLVWLDGLERPFDKFLDRLKARNRLAACFLVQYIKYIMENGENGLATSLPLRGCDGLRLVYANSVWMVYALEPARMLICEQGFDDRPESKIQTATLRINMHKRAHAELIYEK
jgi:hypothetical protein